VSATAPRAMRNHAETTGDAKLGRGYCAMGGIISFSSQSVLGRLARLPLRLVPNGIEMPVKNGINQGLRWITGTGPNHGCWLGTYEADHVPLLRELVKPGMVAYDLGANAGYFTLAFSRLVGQGGHVYAFEPEARNARDLLRNVAINHLTNVTVVQAAVSESSGLVGFGGAEAIGRIGAANSYLIPAIALDEFVAEGNRMPDVVKMDIETAEVLALKGAHKVLASPIAWIMETHSAELRNECKAIMAQFGYRFTDLHPEVEDGWNLNFVARR
jgi:FkbM family methyltransferase